MAASLLIASNRGPIAFGQSPGVAGTAAAAAAGVAGPVGAGPDAGPAARPVPLRRGGGGLVSAMSSPGMQGRAHWVCAALTDADRLAARDSAGAVGPGVQMLAIDPVTFERAYTRVANQTLWFLTHLLFDTAAQPVFDARSARDWQAYRDYGEAFSVALAGSAAPGATVLVQDYHLALTPRQLRERRPDLRIGHFSHTPWAPPEYFRLLPDALAREVLTGMLGADAVGFHSPRWADAFVRCCTEVLGARATDGAVEHEGRRTVVSSHPLGVDAGELHERCARPDVQARMALVREIKDDCQLVLRVDRTELSKNIVRGLKAFRELLRTEPGWRGKVVHLALAYPSRHDLPAYREYTAVVQRVAAEVNDEFATPGWLPVHLEVRDDYPRSLAAYALADVLLVNPVRDGMNLVAKEAPVLSSQGLSLVLSSQAGAADELGAHARVVNPFDVSQTARALHEALLETPEQRREATAALATAATAMPPSAWLDAQIAVLDRVSA